MLHYLWSFMIIVGMVWATLHGTLDATTQSLLDSAGEAVTLGITMLGIMSFWSGILEVGNKAGLLEWLTEKMDPALSFLFPRLPQEHPARRPIAVNMIANMLGLGWVATPAGLEAMQALQPANENRHIATNEMCTFLILNISSLQLIPINMIAYRSQYGSANPMAVVGPALAATAISTFAAVVFCKVVDR